MSVCSTEAASVARALVCGPDFDSVGLCAIALRNLATEVVVAEDGRDALVKAFAHPPDVVVTEAQLPLISGLDLCRLLRGHESTCEATVVIVTDDRRLSEAVYATTSGADVVLAKPCSSTLLLQSIRRIREESEELWSRSDALELQAAEQFDTVHVWIGDSHSDEKRRHLRHSTASPPLFPPVIRCPQCARTSAYRHSYIGGRSERFPEQWDYYECEFGCGTLEYRHRTRSLRRLP